MARQVMDREKLAEAQEAADTAMEAATLAAEKVAEVMPADGQRKVMVNMKITEALADALAERAVVEGITQKQVITRALAAAGLPVPAVDLEEGTRRRARLSAA